MHAVLAPSSAHRWVRCPGSVAAEQLYDDAPTDESLEGDAAHEIAADVLKSYQSPDGPISVGEYLGGTAPNGTIITEEICEGVAVYVLDVLKVCQDGGHLQDMKVETPVTIERVHALNWGTPDDRLYAKEKGHLHIWDFKFGRGMVEARENWQAIDYSVGALDEVTGGNGLADQAITVFLHIVQPRAYHVQGVCRTWKVTGSDLRTYANQLKMAAEQSQLETPPTCAGEWCKNCKASGDCSTLQVAAANITDRIEVLNLNNLDPASAAIELRYLRQSEVLLKERKNGLESQLLEQAKAGTPPPGFGIGYGRPSVVWTVSDQEVIALGEILNLSLTKAPQPITPIQAKKLKVDGAVINQYSKSINGAARLVPTDDTIAGRIFSNNK